MIVSILVAQILFSSSYSTYMLIALTVVSLLLIITLMAYFAKKFISWYVSNKYSVIVLLYGVSFAIIALTSSDTLILDIYNLSTKSTVIYPTSGVMFPSYEKGTPVYFLHAAYVYVDLLSFIILWGATVLLLHEYIRKWRMRHWILVFVPTTRK